MSQAFLVWQQYRTPVIARYALFLLSLWFFLLYFPAELYSRTAGVADLRTTGSIRWMLQTLGGMTFVITAPGFFHSLLGSKMPRGRLVLSFVVDVAVAAAAVAYLVVPEQPVVIGVHVAALFGMIAYGILHSAVRLPSAGDRVLRRALAFFPPCRG